MIKKNLKATALKGTVCKIVPKSHHVLILNLSPSIFMRQHLKETALFQ